MPDSYAKSNAKAARGRDFLPLAVAWHHGKNHRGGMNIQPGDHVRAFTASHEWIPLRALTKVERGQDFPVVWVCDDEDWESATDGSRPEGAIPWPAESIEEAKQ